MTEKSIDQLHIELLGSIFEMYRRMKSDPAQQSRVETMVHHVRMIGAVYAEQGASAVRQFIDQFADAYGDDAETWLYRRWDGLRLNNGSVWIS